MAFSRVCTRTLDDEVSPITALLLRVTGLAGRHDVAPCVQTKIAPIHRDQVILYGWRGCEFGVAVAAKISEELRDLAKVREPTIPPQPTLVIVCGTHLLKKDA